MAKEKTDAQEEQMQRELLQGRVLDRLRALWDGPELLVAGQIACELASGEACGNTEPGTEQAEELYGPLKAYAFLAYCHLRGDLVLTPGGLLTPHAKTPRGVIDYLAQIEAQGRNPFRGMNLDVSILAETPVEAEPSDG